MQKIIALFTLSATLFLGGVASAQTEANTLTVGQQALLTMAQRTLEDRADMALNAISHLTAEQIITDEFISAAIRNNRMGDMRGASWAARESMFQEHQCSIFKGFDKPNSICSQARNLEFSAMRRPEAYEDIGIPSSLASTIRQMRKSLYSIARVYLRQPANLTALYAAKRETILNEVNQLPYQEQIHFSEMINQATTSFLQFLNDDAAAAAYKAYIYDEEARMGGQLEVRTLNESRSALEATVSNSEFFLFAGRRYYEGGPDLVQAYIDIFTDLADALAD